MVVTLLMVQKLIFLEETTTLFNTAFTLKLMTLIMIK